MLKICSYELWFYRHTLSIRVSFRVNSKKEPWLVECAEKILLRYQRLSLNKLGFDNLSSVAVVLPDKIVKFCFYYCCALLQLQLRCHLVHWLKNVAEKIKVSYRTIHLAIYIMDVFMDNHSISKDRLGFVALVCLMLAG